MTSLLPSVTPTVFKLVAHHLLPGMVRTDPTYCRSDGEVERAADENLLADAKAAVQHATTSDCKPLGPSQSGVACERIQPDYLIEDSVEITTYEAARIDGNVVR